ncbi:MAG: hypothetical protein MMC23_001268 [Stictis urceolatum]|nr:hypothetical protein [Stictis urceolata]
MPLWRIWHPANVWSSSDKEALSKAITKLYTDVALPAFYVVVIYSETPAADGVYVGGVKTDKFVRFSIDQIARDSTQFPMARQKAWLDKIEASIAPYVKERGLDWELHIDSTPRSLWRIQGIDPPESGSEAETLWIERNMPVSLDHLKM